VPFGKEEEESYKREQIKNNKCAAFIFEPLVQGAAEW
jgi:adenosylmethionine-8-amino-7-oxononanoate aminotransferase